ncbi:MAG: hypothetical protein FJ100_20180 [Deltaproteobacteria bacterium]|nr:hypothetical protein [Deltaproteobacteria bacterium]
MSPHRVRDDLPTPSVPLGWLPEAGLFRLVAPRAEAVWLVERAHPDDVTSERVTPARHRRAPGMLYWEISQRAPLRYYRYRVRQGDELCDVADPRSHQVARQWQLGHPAWSVAQPDTFDWGGDARPALPLAELVALELHVRDFTAHPSSAVRHPGTYLGLAELARDRIAGLGAVRDLGVNAVELLPVTAGTIFEPVAPHNPTGINHWGYMPSFWMAASERYASSAVGAQADQWVGVRPDGGFDDPGNELRAAIKALHAQGLAVLVDLVFNHVSLHDDNPLARLDPGTWRVRNRDGSLRNKSGCGNDVDGRDPVMRQLIVDSAVHWLRSYRVDGIRLDLGEILDDRCLGELRDACRAAYRRCLLIAEPWSLGGYRPERLAELGFAVWDDRFRNAVRGAHPTRQKGWLFGRADAHVPREALPGLVASVSRSLGGLLPGSHAALHYLESHDDHTLGDVLRLGSGEVAEGAQVSPEAVEALSPANLRRARLAAAVLLLSRGPVMVAQGQEWARAKVQRGAANLGPLDGNTYCRDDASNHLDWQARERQPELVDTYRRLIALRRDWLPELLHQSAPPMLLAADRLWAFGYTGATRRGPIAALFNGDQEADAWFELPGGPWWVLYGGDDAHIVPTPGGVAVQLRAVGAAVLWCG